MSRILRTLTPVLALALTACASSRSTTTAAPTGTPAEQRALAHYTAYAGPPIPEFTWFGHFYSWEGLGKDELVVFTTPSDAYLLKVWPQCDLRFDFNLVGISSTASTVTSHGDYVTVHSPATGPMRCPIDEIRKVDYKRMQADKRAESQAKAQAPAGQR